MKKSIVNLENPNGILVEMTTEEVALKEKDETDSKARKEKILEAKENHKNLKASAKAKLVAGEKLTEEEANVLVGV